jgi:hypothetical protein
MIRHFVIYPILLVMPVAASLQAVAAQPAPVAQERFAQESHTATDDKLQRRRQREGLREDLRAQSGGAAQAPQRQLSPRDRAALRQQLRQQPRDDTRQ